MAESVRYHNLPSQTMNAVVTIIDGKNRRIQQIGKGPNSSTFGTQAAR